MAKAPPAAKRFKLMAPITFGLGVTMLIGYGTLYYPFAIIGPEIAREFGWSESFIFGVFSLALLSSALVAPVMGRMIDRFGARIILFAGSILAAAVLILFSRITGQIGFVLAVLASEAVSTMIFYEAGFAALTAIHGHGARRHISHVTLIAGFASTIFWPLIHWLLNYTDWRGVLLVLAAANLLIAAPIHALVPSYPTSGKRFGKAASETFLRATNEPGLLIESEKRLTFIVMALAFSAGGFLMSAVHSTFFLIIQTMGREAAIAALAGAIIGPMQVGARLIELISGGKVSASIVGVISGTALAFGLGLLFLGSTNTGPLAIILFAVSFGIGQGLSFIARAILPARLFGTMGYGRNTGNLAFVRLIFTAAGPFLTAYCLDHLGLGAAFAVLGGMAVIGLIASIVLVVIEKGAQRRSNAAGQTTQA